MHMGEMRIENEKIRERKQSNFLCNLPVLISCYRRHC